MNERLKEAGLFVISTIALVVVFAASYIAEYGWYAVQDWFWGLW